MLPQKHATDFSKLEVAAFIMSGTHVTDVLAVGPACLSICTAVVLNGAGGAAMASMACKALRQGIRDACRFNALVPESFTMNDAARNGWLHFFRAMSKEVAECMVKHNYRSMHRAMDDAAWHGHLEVLQYMTEKLRFPVLPSIISSAVCKGHLDVVEYLSGIVELPGDFSLNAIDSWEIEVVRFVHERKWFKYEESLFEKAMETGNLEIIKFVFEKMKSDHVRGGIMPENILRTNKATVSYVHEVLGYGFQENAMQVVIDMLYDVNKLDVALYLRDKVASTSVTLRNVFISKSLETIKCLHENFNCECSALSMTLAARFGSLDIVIYLHEHLHPATSDTMEQAIEKDHLDIVKYLHTVVKCKCSNEGVMEWAVNNDHLDMVKYLHTVMKCDCTQHTVVLAAFRNNLQMVKYLCEEVDCDYTHEAFREAIASTYDIEIVKYLYQQAKFSQDSMFRPLIIDDLYTEDVEKIKYMCEEANPVCTPDDMIKAIVDMAAREGSLEIIKYLHNKVQSMCTPKIMLDAVCNAITTANLQVLKFLLDEAPYLGTTYKREVNAAIVKLVANPSYCCSSILKYAYERALLTEELCCAFACSAAAAGHWSLFRFLNTRCSLTSDMKDTVLTFARDRDIGHVAIVMELERACAHINVCVISKTH